ncbi:hypothetical protein PR048_028900 [Dryococelus australis]|uniref:AB hydrolase-1 domain-containing protein n=1 Tax=Dryococelus australis TaxID=614101 RepID=A0ABQ9GEC9_9NEOP|nr:hypothetical protein PR048_028900 [Dryococelus australis]
MAPRIVILEVMRVHSVKTPKCWEHFIIQNVTIGLCVHTTPDKHQRSNAEGQYAYKLLLQLSVVRCHANPQPILKAAYFYDVAVFSFQEMGIYDEPAIIDYVLEITQHPKLIYVAHSMGASIFFAMLNFKPEYNSKLMAAFMLAPACFCRYTKSFVFRFLPQAVHIKKVIIYLKFIVFHKIEGKQTIHPPPFKLNRVQLPAGSLLDFRTRKSCRKMPLVVGFSRRSPVSPHPFIPELLHTPLISPSSALKTSTRSRTEFLESAELKRYGAAMECVSGGNWNDPRKSGVIPPGIDFEEIHGDSSPFLLQPFHELRNGFWPRLTSPHPAVRFVPKMFYRVEVGALGGPVQSANIVVGDALDAMGIYEVLPRLPIWRQLASKICSDMTPLLQLLCTSTLSSIEGSTSENLNKTHLVINFSHFPAGASVQTLAHFGQNMLSGNFNEYNYGAEENRALYGRETPKPYRLQQVTIPVILYCGGKDLMSDCEDIKYLYSQLLNSEDKYFIVLEEYAHVDFIWGMDTESYLYKDLLARMESYTTKYLRGCEDISALVEEALYCILVLWRYRMVAFIQLHFGYSPSWSRIQIVHRAAFLLTEVNASGGWFNYCILLERWHANMVDKSPDPTMSHAAYTHTLVRRRWYVAMRLRNLCVVVLRLSLQLGSCTRITANADISPQKIQGKWIR